LAWCGLLWLVGDVSGRTDHPKGFQSNIVGIRYFPMKAEPTARCGSSCEEKFEAGEAGGV